MNKLVLNNTISQLFLESQSINNLLYKSLRFKDPKCFHTKMYKLWIKTRGKVGHDGNVEFYTKDGKFGTGLLPEIIKATSKLNIKLKVEDNRSSPINIQNITPDFLEGVTLYDFQHEIANKAWKYERGIIKAATGAGKTLVFTAMVKAIHEQKVPTLILTRAKTLVHQTYERLEKSGIQNLGVITGNYFNPNFILCATIGSAHKYEQLIDKFKVLIVDECHEFGTEKSIDFFKKLTNCRYRFGFSATPWDPKDKIKKHQMKSWFGPLLGDISTQELQERNILSNSTCYFHTIESPDLDEKDYQDAYDQGVVNNKFLVERIKKIISTYKEGRILIVVERLEHGDNLQKAIPDAHWVQGRDDDETRKYVIDKLNKSEPGELVVGISTRILQTGIDLFVHSVINAAGYKSYYMTIQRIGRGLRLSPDKECLDYHDFLFLNNDHLQKHSRARIRTLTKEGHKMVII